MAPVLSRQFTSDAPVTLYMATDNVSSTKADYLFVDYNGALQIRVAGSGAIFEKKVVTDGSGNFICKMSKNPLSMAKWKIKDAQDIVLVRTSTVAGLAKYGLEVRVPSRGSKVAYMVAPDGDLSQVVIWATPPSGKIDRAQGTVIATAQYGSNVALGILSTLANNFSFIVHLEPGTDAALVACLLGPYLDVIEWNNMQAVSGFGTAMML